MALPHLILRPAGLALLLAAVTLASQLAPRSHAASSNCDSTGAVDAEELHLFGLINDYRAQNGHEPFVFSHHLNRSAAWKAQDMADEGYVAHDDTPIDRTWDNRIRACGYTFNTYFGENIAGGDPTAAGTLDVWQHSSSHNALMLNDTFVAAGIGRAYNADGYPFWVLDVGGVADPPGAGGDVDCSGRVDAADATLILQRSAGLVSAFPCDTEADMDASGRVSPMDALLVLQEAAGLTD
jgi:uncharacterized protein YkwD